MTVMNPSKEKGQAAFRDTLPPPVLTTYTLPLVNVDLILSGISRQRQGDEDGSRSVPAAVWIMENPWLKYQTWRISLKSSSPPPLLLGLSLLYHQIT